MSNGTPNTGLKTFAEQYATPAMPAANTQAQPTAALNNIQEGAVDNKATKKGDALTIAGKQISKKKAIIGGAVILAAIASGIALFAKGKIPREVNKLTKEANELAAEAQKTIDSVTAKFNEIINSGKTEATIEGNLVKIVDDADDILNQKIMNEFSADGQTLLRKSKFNILKPQEGIQETVKYEPYMIQEFIQGTNKYNQVDFENGKLSAYTKEIEEIASNSWKAASNLTYKEDGSFNIYGKGVEVIDANWKSAQAIGDFNSKGEPTVYVKNFGADKEKIYKLNENGKWKKDNEPEYLEDFEDYIEEDEFLEDLDGE